MIKSDELSLTYLKLSQVEATLTAHTAGTKKVLSNGRKDLTRVTQIAWGTLIPFEEIPFHSHKDMDEYFFFTKGKGEIKVEDKVLALAEGVFLKIPAAAGHSLKCFEETLEFFYFGMEVYEVD